MNKETNAKYIYNELTKAGATPEGACGVLGNLEAESGIEPTNLQNSYNSRFGMTDVEYTERTDSGSYLSFRNDAAGYGLAQWTAMDRKDRLLSFIRARGYNSIGSLEGQTAYLLYELKSCYPTVWSYLCNCNSVRSSAIMVLMRYEIPADQSVAVQDYRTQLGENWYKKLVSDQIPPVEQTEPNVEPVQGFFPPRTIDRNMVGSDVLMMQAILNCRGYGCRCDGIFGLETERKVKQFQKDEKLVEDAICGKKTWTKLFKVKWG